MKKTLTISGFIAFYLIVLSVGFEAGHKIRGLITPGIIRSWQEKIAEGEPGTIIIVTDRDSDMELGRKYDIPITMRYDNLWYSNGGIYSYTYPYSYYEPSWIPPLPTSTIWYFDRDGSLLGAYRADYKADLPTNIEVYFDSADLPKNCDYSKGTITKLIKSGRVYFLEIYDDGDGWSRGCDSQ